MLKPAEKGRASSNNDIIARAANVDIEKIHPQIAGMAKEILDQYKNTNLGHICAEMEPIYEWCQDALNVLGEKGKIEYVQVENANSEESLSMRLKIQRDILGITSENLREYSIKYQV